MIVKCIKEKIYEDGSKNNVLVLGKEYIAYSIVSEKETMKFIILDECGSFPRYDINYFIIVDGKVPNNYLISYGIKNEIWIEPTEFKGDLLERYYDDDDEAIKAIENLTKRIKEFHNWQSEEDKKAIEEEKNKDPYAWPYSDDVW